MDNALWLARLLFVAAGSWLTSRGIGDAALWEAVTGAALAAIGAAWSYRARRQAIAAVPPEVAAELDRLRQVVGQ